MFKKEIEVYQKNLQLKNEFGQLGLDYGPVYFPNPYDLEAENLGLTKILAFTKKYLECRSRKVMELLGNPYPPISAGWSPDSHWFCFELWLDGQPLQYTAKELLSDNYDLKAPADLKTEEAVIKELQVLNNELDKANLHIDQFFGECPPIILYMLYYETLQSEVDVEEVPGLEFSHCKNYCPGCVLRPWCELGQEMCWSDDDKMDKMVFPDSIADFVSASPMSIQLLRDADIDYQENKVIRPANQDGENPCYLGRVGVNEERTPVEQIPPNWN